MDRFVDGIRRSFVRPQYLTAVASGNAATLSTDLVLFSKLVVSDDIIGHSLTINYSLAAKVGATGGPQFVVAVGNNSTSTSLNAGVGGFGGIASLGNSGVVATARLLVPLGTVTDLAIAGNQVIDLREGVWNANTAWSIFLTSAVAAQVVTADVSITLCYNSTRELLK